MSNKKRKIDDKKRVFQTQWESDYLITSNKNKIPFLACMQIMSVPKEYNLKRHYTTLHSNNFDIYTGESRTTIIAEYKKKLMHQRGFLAKRSTVGTYSLAASYKVSLELVKAKKPLSDGVIVKKCAIEMTKQFNEPKLAEKFETVVLSHQTVTRRIEHMDQYVSKSCVIRFQKVNIFY